MTPFVDDVDFHLYVGDVRDCLRELPAESVHTVVTSPPYHGLRDYSADGQIGLEPTVGEYVSVMVDVFREVRRVLRNDGTLWCNLGDAFADKQMQGVPWRVAFALQADGWYLRSDIIWAKPNPMPESVTDRPTKAHEYVFLLSKSPRYFFDQEAVREPADRAGETIKGDRAPGGLVNGGWLKGGIVAAGRNLRSVWEIATQPYPDAHFATFPEALPERCIKAGSSERGCCPECGAPWVREVEDRPVVATVDQVGPSSARYGEGLTAGTPAQYRSHGVSLGRPPAETTGWRRNCDPGCVNGGKFQTQNPCVVLDPFMGSGTTALVARRLGRRSIGVELNPEYAALCARRLQQLSLLSEVGS